MGSSPRNFIQSILIVLIIINKCNCDTVFIENAGILLPEGKCTIGCMRHIRIDLIHCHDNCKQSNRSVQLEQVKTNGTIRLLCSYFDLISHYDVSEERNLLVSYLLKSNDSNGIWDGRRNELYVVKAQKTNNKSSQQFAHIIGIPINHVENPMNNSIYLVNNSDAAILSWNLTARSGIDSKYCDRYTMQIFGRLENKQHQTQTEIVEEFYPKKKKLFIIIPLIAMIFVFALSFVQSARDHARNAYAHPVEIELRDLQFHV